MFTIAMSLAVERSPSTYTGRLCLACETSVMQQYSTHCYWPPVFYGGKLCVCYSYSLFYFSYFVTAHVGHQRFFSLVAVGPVHALLFSVKSQGAQFQVASTVMYFCCVP